MTDTDRPRFGVAVKTLCAAFGRELTQAALEAYWAGLSDLPIGRVEEGILWAIRREPKMPPPAVVREYAGRSPRDRRPWESWADWQRRIEKSELPALPERRASHGEIK